MSSPSAVSDPPVVDPQSALAEDLEFDVLRSDDVSSLIRPQPSLPEANARSQLRASREDHIQTMQSAEIARLHQQNEMRPQLFDLASRLSWAVVLGNFAIVGWYAAWAQALINPQVLMFWISSTVVEVLGIIYIIAQYLFPKPKAKDQAVVLATAPDKPSV